MRFTYIFLLCLVALQATMLFADNVDEAKQRAGNIYLYIFIRHLIILLFRNGCKQRQGSRKGNL